MRAIYHFVVSVELSSSRSQSSEYSIHMASENPVWKQAVAKEFLTPEGCYILETYNQPGDELMSIARARVKQGVTTAWHALDGIVERYIIAEGSGRVEVGNLPASDVAAGDVVIIPSGVRQRITNTGNEDLIFYCVCTPRFQQSAYRSIG